MTFEELQQLTEANTKAIAQLTLQQSDISIETASKQLEINLTLAAISKQQELNTKAIANLTRSTDFLIQAQEAILNKLDIYVAGLINEIKHLNRNIYG